MSYNVFGDELVTQRQVAAGLGISEEHLSRTLRRARQEGVPLPPHGIHPCTGVTGWYLAAFTHWWHRWHQRPRPRVLTRERLQVELAKGLDDRGIADRYELSVRAVRATAKAYGIQVPRRIDMRRERCVRLAAGGLKPWQIARLVGCGESTVYAYLRQARRAAEQAGGS